MSSDEEQAVNCKLSNTKAELSFGINNILKKSPPTVVKSPTPDCRTEGCQSIFQLQQQHLFLSAQDSICAKPLEYRRVGHPYQNRTPPKRKKPRTTFNRDQIGELEKRFLDQKYLASSERISLARQLKLTDCQVKTWFQNRRTKWRRQTAEERESERNATAKLIMNFTPASLWQPFIPLPRRFLDVCRNVPLSLP